MSIARVPGLYDPRLKALAKLSNNPFVALFGDFKGQPFASHQGNVASPSGGLIIGKDGLDTLDGVDDNLFIPSALGIGTTNNWSIIVGVTIPDTVRKGAFVKIGSGANGFAIGVGATTFDDTGNDLISLKEAVSWGDSNVTIGTGFHTVAIFHRVVGTTDTIYYYIDGANVGLSHETAPIAPSAETRIGGYTARYTDCKIHFVLIGDSLRQGGAEHDNVLITEAARLFPAGVWEQRVLEKPRDSWFAVASGATPLTASDTTSLSLTESQASLLRSTRTDNVSTSLTESQASLSRLTRVDSVSASLGEASSLRVAFPRSDSLGVSLTEAQSSLLRSTRTESLSVSLSESQAGLLRSSRVDSTSLSFGEVSSLRVPFSRADSTTLSLTEVASVLASASTFLALVSTDTLGLSLSEASVRLKDDWPSLPGVLGSWTPNLATTQAWTPQASLTGG